MIKLFHQQNRQAIDAPTPNPGSPDVSTVAAIELQAQDTPSLIFQLSLNDIGDSPIIEKGIYYATHNDPGPSDTKVNVSTGGSSPIFGYKVENLDFHTVYYFKAFATNSQGTDYGIVMAALSQSSDIVSELWHENVGSTSVDFGIRITKFYIFDPISISQVLLYLDTSNPPQTTTPTYSLPQKDLYVSELPFKYLASFGGGFNDLLPNTTYYYTANLQTTVTGWDYNINYYGVRSFTTLP